MLAPNQPSLFGGFSPPAARYARLCRLLPEGRKNPIGAGYRAIIAHHRGDKSRQEEELQKLFNALRKAILQPP